MSNVEARATPVAGPVRTRRRTRAGQRLAKFQALPIDHPLRRIAGRLRVVGRRQRSAKALSLAIAAEGLRAEFESLSEAEFDMRRNRIAQALRSGGVADPALVDGLALVREAARRTLKVTPYREQLAAAAALISGHVVEMATGEGKTIAAALPAALQALAGRFVHVVTSNDYLAQRDAELLTPFHAALGLRCGFVVNGMPPDERRAIYAMDVVHVSNKELVFDFLRDRLLSSGTSSERTIKTKTMRALGLMAGQGAPIQRGLDVCIVDEIDSVLIDEAGTPLIISATGEGSITPELAQEAIGLARHLVSGLHFERIGDTIGIDISEAGLDEIGRRSAAFAQPEWRQHVRREELARAAITATHLLKRDQHYIVRDGKVVIIDENSGRTMPDRFWGDALHPMVEHKEGCDISPLRRSLAAISFQRFFLRYPVLSGMSGTVAEVAHELSTIYGMPLTTIPRRLPLQRRVARRQVFESRDILWTVTGSIAQRFVERGQPLLIGVGSVREAAMASKVLTELGIRHQVLSAAQDKDEADAVARAGQPGMVTVATNMAGRGTDIHLGDGVAGLGGLAVLLCERHSSSRVDRQLIGRCARQGDPGLAMELLSQEDAIIDNLPKWLVPSARFLCRRWPFEALVFKLAQDRGENAARRRRFELVRRDEKVAKMLGFAGGME